MTNEIEKDLFDKDGTHALVSFLVNEDQLELKIAPWSDLSKIKIFIFNNIKLKSVQPSNTDELPFDIIGIDSTKLDSCLMQFCIHCSECEYVFTGKWPVRVM